MFVARLSVVAMLATLAGCGAQLSQLKSRAAYDLNCPQESIHLTKIDSRTQGVSGCGQRATYIESCDAPPGAFARNCTWVLNSDSTKS